MNTALLYVYSACALLVCILGLFFNAVVKLGRFVAVSPIHAFLLYHALLFAVFPIVSFSAGVTTFPMFNTEAAEEARQTALASIYATVMVVSIGGGFLLGTNHWTRRTLDLGRRRAEGRGSLSQVPRTREGAVSVAGLGAWLVIVSLSLIGFAFIFYSAGGVRVYAERFVEFRYRGHLVPGFVVYGATIVPGYLGILMLIWYRRGLVVGAKFAWLGFGTVLYSLFAISTCGFRINMVPVIWAFVAMYHLEFAKLRLRWLAISAFGGAVFLGLLGFFRDWFERGDAVFAHGGFSVVDNVAIPLAMRVPGTEMHRIVRDGMARGYDLNGIVGPLIESTTIIVPRWLWPSKPSPQSLEFGYTFLGDFLFWRNRGEMSEFTGGFSPTFAGYMIWLGGDVFCIAGALVFGWICGRYQVWLSRMRSVPPELAVIILGIGSQIPKFAEAPQDALNGVVMISFVLCLILAPIYFLRKIAA